MKAHDFRNMTAAELQTRLSTMEQEYYSAIENVRAGKEKNHASVRGLRRDIARATTVLRELSKPPANLA